MENNLDLDKLNIIRSRINYFSGQKSPHKYYKQKMWRDIKELTKLIDVLLEENERLRRQNDKLYENLERFSMPPQTVGEMKQDDS